MVVRIVNLFIVIENWNLSLTTTVHVRRIMQNYLSRNFKLPVFVVVIFDEFQSSAFVARIDGFMISMMPFFHRQFVNLLMSKVSLEKGTLPMP